MHHLKVIIILCWKTSHQKLYMLMLLSMQWMMKYQQSLPNSSNKLKFFLLSEVSKLIDSVMNMKQGDQRSTGFLEKKEFNKITIVNSLLAKIQKYLTNWWIVLWSNRFTSFTRNFLISQNVQHKMQKKTLELRKENKKEVASQNEYS